MKKHTRTLVLGASAIIALSTLTACSGGSTPTTEQAPATTETTAAATAFPASARYIADMNSAGGKTMTIGISVDGENVVAYACDGTTDEAWFFGTQKDGTIDITSKFQDTLQASFDGTDVDGDLTMNDVQYDFAAAPVSGAAGMYTVAEGTSRASWVVRPDDTMIGVLKRGSGDGQLVKAINEDQQKFKDRVRNQRLARQLSQAPPLQLGTWGSNVNGVQVVAVIVDGNTRF